MAGVKGSRRHFWEVQFPAHRILPSRL